MSLKKKIEEKLNEALKAKDKDTYPTLRLVLSAIKDAEIASRTKGQKEMSDSDILVILKKIRILFYLQIFTYVKKISIIYMLIHPV